MAKGKEGDIYGRKHRVLCENDRSSRRRTAGTDCAGEAAGLRRQKSGLCIVGIVVGVLALAYIAACAAVQFLYNDTALPHTDVLGVDVSGQAAQQIEALWEQQGERVLHDTAVTLTESGESIGAVTLEELGVTVTPQAAAVAAGASRRYESWGGGALAWLRGGYELDPQLVCPDLRRTGAGRGSARRWMPPARSWRHR